MRAIDLFAGAGGFTTAATRAGCDVLWAANHWDLAVAAHAANHRGVQHVCQDLRQADFTRVPAHDLLLASPACQGHSQAASRGGGGRRGGAAKHDDDRATAWAVVDCAEKQLPSWVLVENVVEFQGWCSNARHTSGGTKVCTCGSMFRAWRAAMEAIGYSLTTQVINSADLGVPQDRKRLFVVGQLDGPGLALEQPQEEWVPVKELLDLRTSRGSWKRVKDAPPAVAGRIANGRRNVGRRFVTQHVSRHPGRELNRPIGTLTTKNHWGVVVGDHYRMLTVGELKACMGFPRDYQLPCRRKRDAVKLLGNAIVPAVGQWVIEQIMEAA